MTTTFKYLNKKYTVNIDPLRWYETARTTLVKLPNGDILALNHLVDSKTPYVVPTNIIEATEVDVDELAFQSLLKEYNLTDNAKTRKLWYKCYEKGHSGGLYEMCDQWHDLVDLIID